MKRHYALVGAGIICIAALLAGCSTDGDVTVKNEASTNFTGVLHEDRIEIPAGGQVTMNIYIGKSLLFVGPEERDISLTGSAYTKKPFTTTMNITNGESTTYSIKDDCGALILENGFSSFIDTIKVKHCTDTQFGPTILGPNETITTRKDFLIRLDDGCWDIAIYYFDSEAHWDTIFNFPSDLGEVTLLVWHPDSTYIF